MGLEARSDQLKGLPPMRVRPGGQASSGISLVYERGEDSRPRLVPVAVQSEPWILFVYWRVSGFMPFPQRQVALEGNWPIPERIGWVTRIPIEQQPLDETIVAIRPVDTADPA